MFKKETLLLFSVMLLMASCKREDITRTYSAQTAIDWADMTLSVIKQSTFKSPTYPSRALGYMGLCLYECMVHSDSGYRSLNGQLTGLNNLPQPETGVSYNWTLVANAGQHHLLKLLYPVPDNLGSHAQVDQLFSLIQSRESNGLPGTTINRSIQLGKAIAQTIYEWSKTDGGHEGFKRNFDPNFIFPDGPGYWMPPAVGQMVSPFPLHPRWGSNRTFVAADSLLPIPQMKPFSENPASEFYNLYKEVYEKNITLTQEEKEIAAWWTDDPTETFSPPGHSYNLATITIKKVNAPPIKAAETYARVGMAVADAFINCWKAKYTYFNERPSTFVWRNITPNWKPYWPEPPFPAFPSGHATQGAAAATVLESLYGAGFSFVDNTHEGAKRFSTDLKFRPRSFSSFWQVAEEIAYSRFLGGIHTRQDNETGLQEGRKIGSNINSLLWHR